MGKNTQWVYKRKSNTELFHSGTKGMKWGYNNGKPNGKRKAADISIEEIRAGVDADTAKAIRERHDELVEKEQTLRDKCEAANWKDEALYAEHKKVYLEMLEAEDQRRALNGGETNEEWFSKHKAESLSDTRGVASSSRDNKRKYVKNIVTNDGFKTLSPDIQRRLLKELND